jgi:transcription initiation factor IIE alpha subunit
VKRMTDTVIVALLSLAGTAIGSILGIFANNKLVIYRLEQLEKKVERHNNVVERVALLEKDVNILKGGKAS